MAVDAMDEVEDRQRVRLVAPRHVDIHVSPDLLAVAVPPRVTDVTRYGGRVGRPDA